MATLHLNTTNPYARGFVVNLQDDQQILKRTKLEYNPLVSRDKTHIVKESENIWDLAFKYYGNSKLWYIIADCNSIFNPFELTINSTVIIPDLDNFR